MAHLHILSEQADRSCGAGVYMAELVRQLADRGHRIALVCHNAARDLEEVCAVHRLPLPKSADLPFFWRFGAVLRPAAYRLALRELGLFSPDAVIASSAALSWAHRRLFPRAPLIYRPSALVAPTELATYPFSSNVQRWVAIRSMQHLERAALRRAAVTIRFTRTACAALINHYGRDVARRFRLVHAPMVLPPETSVIDPQQPPRLLSVGRLVETKNLMFLIRSLARHAHAAWTLDIVGDGEERPALEKEVRKRQLSGRVRFHGHQNDVARWYREASLFLFPTRLESCGMVLLEAKSHGVPALAIRADGRNYRNVNHELIEHDRDGFLADDEEQFGRLLGQLIRNPARLVEAGRAARKRIEHRHRWDDHIEEYEEILARLRRRRCRA